MLRDPALYPDPDAFRPERFLSTSPESPIAGDEKQMGTDPRQFVFGFGRRRCPGAHLVEESLWMVMALVVAVLDVSAPSGDEGVGKVTFDNAVFRCASLFVQ